MFHALKGFGKKATASVSASDAEKLTARKEKMVEKTRQTRTDAPDSSYYNRKIKKTSSSYSSRDRQERRYRKVMTSNRLTVINETM